MSWCKIPGCPKRVLARGWCGAHYQAWKKHGDPLGKGHIGRLPGTIDGRDNPNWRGGKSSHPLYETYNDMIGRCTRPTHARWADYGGRGITVCERWREDFWNYVADVGPRPEGTVSDRIDNDGNYEPGNFRWATLQQSALNRRPSALWRRIPSPPIRPRGSHCTKGHERNQENLYVSPDGEWHCRACRRERRRGS